MTLLCFGLSLKKRLIYYVLVGKKQDPYMDITISNWLKSCLYFIGELYQHVHSTYLHFRTRYCPTHIYHSINPSPPFINIYKKNWQKYLSISSRFTEFKTVKSIVWTMGTLLTDNSFRYTWDYEAHASEFQEYLKEMLPVLLRNHPNLFSQALASNKEMISENENEIKTFNFAEIIRHQIRSFNLFTSWKLASGFAFNSEAFIGEIYEN